MSNNIGTLGFNGEFLDSTLDNYNLGNGYRAYNPAIMAFTAPDDMSPFGHGGINPYVYVSGDPINNIDPTGHFNILGFVTGIGLATFSIASMGTAILATVASGGGLSLPALGVIAGSAYGIYSGITQVIDATHQNDSIGKQLVNFGINVGITMAAEFGGWALGAGIKTLAPGASGLIERAVGMVAGRTVSREAGVEIEMTVQNSLRNGSSSVNIPEYLGIKERGVDTGATSDRVSERAIDVGGQEPREPLAHNNALCCKDSVLVHHARAIEAREIAAREIAAREIAARAARAKPDRSNNLFSTYRYKIGDQTYYGIKDIAGNNWGFHAHIDEASI